MLLGIIVSVALAGGVFNLKSKKQKLALPKATLLVACVTLVVGAIGNIFPTALNLLGRNLPHLQQGETWRWFTPLFVQDGGWAGLIFNLLTLLIIGTLIETIFGKRRFLITYFVAGFISEIAAYTILQHQGFAGNSVANMGLAGLLFTALLTSKAEPVRVIGLVGMGAGLILLFTGNLHGVGFISGVVIAYFFHKTRGADQKI